VHLPDPIISLDSELQPEEEAMLADSVGLALLVVLDSLGPAERLAFVLHDVFRLPFEEIAPMVGRTPAAARQLASRARRRIEGSEIPSPDPDRSRQRAVVDAFFSAARGGNFDGLLALLDPEIVLRADFGAKHADRSVVVRGAPEVARSAIVGGKLAGAVVIPVLVNGAAGAVIVISGRPFAVMGFIVAEGRIVEMDVIADPQRVRGIAAPVLDADQDQRS
ncbi:MAG TPA: sigma factor-like helix-turn-helix DNA-binding protein, partial [Candidatus Acidoferrum sp.]|nr:sigma factor-like helix-turn-helix DNA-binding protein [Candidatus Acidoferrum sp.]